MALRDGVGNSPRFSDRPWSSPGTNDKLVQPGDDNAPDVTLLQSLPLTREETARVEQVAHADVPFAFVHLPVFGLRAEEP